MPDFKNDDIKTYRLRVTYKKCENLAFLSHLEIISAIEKIIRRSSLPFAITKGFSPRIKISFGLALSVGMSSQNEIFDLYLINYIDCTEVLKKLKDSSVHGIEFLSVIYVDKNTLSPDNCLKEIKWSIVLDSNEAFDLNIPEFINISKKNKIKTYKVCDYLVKKPYVITVNQHFNILFTLKVDACKTIKPLDFLKNCVGEDKFNNFKIISIDKENIY